jgi:hypothetical protein
VRKLNKPLLRRLARKLRRLRHEEHFNQSTWAQVGLCGTAACIAGHAVIEAGWRPVEDPDEPEMGYLTHCRKGNGRIEDIEGAAARLLGLPSPDDRDCWGDDEIYDLFSGDAGHQWPKPYADRWLNKTETGERPSRIAADLLDAIADGKVSL